MNLVFVNQSRKKAVWGPKRTLAAVLIALLSAAPASAGHKSHGPKKGKPGAPNSFAKFNKLDDELERRANNGRGDDLTSVIVTMTPGAPLPPDLKKFTNMVGLGIINSVAVDVPNHLLRKLARHPSVFSVHYDRPVKSHNYRTAVTVGARDVFGKYGYNGAGIGVAVIDSGITSWHDDLVNYTSKMFPYGNQRVSKFVDFVSGRTLPYDDNGHGTHVSGIIAGVGYDSKLYEKAGIAPQASLVSLKVLDENGAGRISQLIAALNWVALNYKAYNIKVVNMSVGAGVYESYWTDPLTLAAKVVVEKGVTIVAAAGNEGKNADGQLQWGGITAPGNAPWVLTVGASSTNGTLSRLDDTMAGFSSSGPTPVDFSAKPDLVAPGVGTISLTAAGSLFETTKAQYLVKGKTGQSVYLALSGTSMAAPVVSGTVALMYQANPNLTPNLVKAILEYTAEAHGSTYGPLREGAGFLNTLGAVDMARFFATQGPGSTFPVASAWSRQILWGNHRLQNGDIVPTANAWSLNIVWGTAKTLGDSGDNIVWGTASSDGDNIVWGTSSLLGNVVWGTAADGDNIVWGTAGDGDNIVWGTSADGDNVVWGTDCGGSDCDNVVWGTMVDGDNIVWGTAADGDNVVWGTAADGDNVVWGTAAAGDNVVWGTSALGNIVWSTTDSNNDVTWGNSGNDQVIFPDESLDVLPSTLFDFSQPIVVGGSSPLGGL